VAADHPYLDWYTTDDAACAWTRVVREPGPLDSPPDYGGLIASAREASVFFRTVAEYGTTGAEPTARGIYRTDDRGASWRQLHALDMTYRRVYADASGRHDFLMFSDAPERRWYWGIDGGATLEGLHGAGPLDGGWDFRVTTAKVDTGAAIWVQSTPPDGNGQQVLDRSLDDGDTWARVPLGYPDDPSRCVLAVSPAAPGRVYAACNSSTVGTRHRLYVSHDAASTWKVAHEWTGAMVLNDLWARDDDADGLVLLGDAPYVSTDGGQTFAKIALPVGPPEFRLDQVLPSDRPGFPYLLQGDGSGFAWMDATGSDFRPFDGGLPALRWTCLLPLRWALRSPLPPHAMLATGGVGLALECWPEYPEAR
jgi:photosystem II stability/assembly factor-like uncharacterized protein